jgi:16S rRNA processing protein RimM
MVVVGQIKGARGIRGDLKVEVLTDNPRRLSTGGEVYLEGRRVVIERSRAINKGSLLKIESVDNRTEAIRVQGKFLMIPEEDVEPLPEGSYYHFQLLDMNVWTDDNKYLGELKEIIFTGSNDVYVVRVESEKKEWLIPALKEVILQVDPDASRMEVRLPEGLS